MVTHGWLFGIRFIEHLLLVATQQEIVNERAAEWRNEVSPRRERWVRVQVKPRAAQRRHLC